MATDKTIRLSLDASEVRKGEEEFTRSAARIAGAVKGMAKSAEALTRVGDSGKSVVDMLAPKGRQAEGLTVSSSPLRVWRRLPRRLATQPVPSTT